MLLHLPLNSNIFMKAQCVCKGALEFSHESVRVNFRRSTDKCGNITRITYNNNKNCKSTFVCYISNAIPGFAWKLTVFTKVRYELSRESVCVYLRRSKDKRDNITRIIYNKTKQTEIQHFLLYLPLNSRICMKNQCFYKSALRIQPRRRLRLLEDVEGYKRRHYKNHRQKQQRKTENRQLFVKFPTKFQDLYENSMFLHNYIMGFHGCCIICIVYCIVFHNYCMIFHKYIMAFHCYCISFHSYCMVFIVIAWFVIVIASFFIVIAWLFIVIASVFVVIEWFVMVVVWFFMVIA